MTLNLLYNNNECYIRLCADHEENSWRREEKNAVCLSFTPSSCIICHETDGEIKGNSFFFLFLVFKAMKLKVTNDYVIFIFLIIVTLWYSYKYILRINRGMEENGREIEIERGREYSCNEAMSMAEKRGITIINTYAWLHPI